jgi:hypothetical protein
VAAEHEEHGGSDASAEERRRQVAHEGRRRWREANAEHVAEYQRKYRRRAKARDPEKWAREHREEMRRSNLRRRRRRERNATSRAKYAENLELSRERSRMYRRQQVEREKAADPEAYRLKHNAEVRAWRAKNRDALNARRRENYRQDPEPTRVRARERFERNKEHVRAKRREYYQSNKEKVLASNRAYKERERRRREAGLPPHRLQQVTRQERERNRAAAEEFFTRPLTPERRDALERTSPDLIAKWQAETARLRAIHGYAEDEPVRERLQREREACQLMQQRQRDHEAAHQAAEDARLDDIARTINNRLRTQPRRARSTPSWPAVSPQHRSRGL